MTDAKQIAERINESGRDYYGQRAKGWDGPTCSRIYFGRDYVTIEATGEIHNRRDGKARAKTIGDSAVELVLEVAATLTAISDGDKLDTGAIR